MMVPFNTDLMKHPTAVHTAPTTHERAANRARRAARRNAFLAFVHEVFAQPPRHPLPKINFRFSSTP